MCKHIHTHKYICTSIHIYGYVGICHTIVFLFKIVSLWCWDLFSDLLFKENTLNVFVVFVRSIHIIYMNETIISSIMQNAWGKNQNVTALYFCMFKTSDPSVYKISYPCIPR